MSKDRYIVATCRPWGERIFHECFSEDNSWILIKEKKQLTASFLNAIKPRFVFFLHWNWIVPKDIYESYECVCFHMTDVPYGRGGSPLQNLILRGHATTQLTALNMVEALDAGPVYAKQALSLEGRAQEVYERATILSIKMARWISEHQPLPIEQEGAVTIFKRRTPEQSRIPVGLTQKELVDFIRMLDAEGYPLAFIEYGNIKLEFSNANQENNNLVANVRITIQEPEQNE